MTQYPYAGGSWKFTGPSYKAMAILGVVAALLIGIVIGLCEYASTSAHAQWPFRRQSAWQVWSQQCALRTWGGRLPDYCINAYRAVTGQ
jgi:hypothetical protein